MNARELKCDECPKVFSEAELEAEDPQAWGHPCSRADACESHRSIVTPNGPLNRMFYLPTVVCPTCGRDVCVRADGTMVPHFRQGTAPPCESSNQLAPVASPAEGQGSLF